MILTEAEQNLLQRYLHSRASYHDAQDIAQDVAIALLPVVIDDIYRRRYILTVAKRIAISSARKRVLRKTVEIPQDAQSPAVDIDNADIVRRIDDALPSLSHDERVAIILHAYLQYTVQQISDCTGDSYDTIKSRISRARQKLSELVSPEI